MRTKIELDFSFVKKHTSTLEAFLPPTLDQLCIPHRAQIVFTTATYGRGGISTDGQNIQAIGFCFVWYSIIELVFNWKLNRPWLVSFFVWANSVRWPHLKPFKSSISSIIRSSANSHIVSHRRGSDAAISKRIDIPTAWLWYRIRKRSPRMVLKSARNNWALFRAGFDLISWFVEWFVDRF